MEQLSHCTGVNERIERLMGGKRKSESGSFPLEGKLDSKLGAVILAAGALFRPWQLAAQVLFPYLRHPRLCVSSFFLLRGRRHCLS